MTSPKVQTINRAAKWTPCVNLPLIRGRLNVDRLEDVCQNLSVTGTNSKDLCLFYSLVNFYDSVHRTVENTIRTVRMDWHEASLTDFTCKRWNLKLNVIVCISWLRDSRICLKFAVESNLNGNLKCYPEIDREKEEDVKILIYYGRILLDR